jgi:tetratricopeptide (TPR) repeat protein
MDPRSTFAIVVGIEKYEEVEGSNLLGPAHDAVHFTEWLVACGVPAENTLVFVSSLEEVTFPSGVVVEHEATRHTIDEAVRNTLRGRQEELLFFFWGGHGVIQADLTHRLFYADATDDDKKNLPLMDLLLALRSTYFKKPALRQQIVIVDACATFAERLGWVYSLPTDTLPKGKPVSGREQFVLFATKPGEAALNLNDEKTGLFSRELLRVLTGDSGWPPDFKKTIEQLDDRFKKLSDDKQANQTPSYYWFKAGDSFVREFSIPELLLKKLVTKSSEQLTANAKLGQVDFNSNIKVWAEENGLDVEQIKAQLNQWVAQLERTPPEDASKLALAEFYKKNFSRAGDLFNQAADEYVAKLEDIEQQQAQLEEELRQRRASVVENRRRAGNALVQAYRFAEALSSYEQALMQVSQQSDPAVWAAIKIEVGIANWQLGIQVAGASSAEHLNQAVQAYRQALKVRTREQFPLDWAMTQNNLAAALRDQAARAEGAEAVTLLGQAVEAYRQALKVYTREQFPQQWAMVQNNLANALCDRAARAEGVEAVHPAWPSRGGLPPSAQGLYA